MTERKRSGGGGRVWALLPVLVPFLVTLTSTMGAVDLAYHVRVGDGILETGALPRSTRSHSRHRGSAGWTSNGAPR